MALAHESGSFFTPNVETAKASGEVPSHIDRSDGAPISICRSQALKQFRGRDGKHRFGMRHERFFIKSVYQINKNI